MNILFLLLDLNVGGTEKSLLNLIAALPKEYKITLLLLERKGGYLNSLPQNVELVVLPNGKLINEFIQASPPAQLLASLKAFQPRKFTILLRNYLARKMGTYANPFSPIRNYLTAYPQKFDYAVAYMGPHNFMTYYILNFVEAAKRIQWIHFDIEKIYVDKPFILMNFPKFDKIICVSSDVEEKLVAKFPILATKTEVVHNKISKKEIEEKRHEAIEESVFTSYKGLKFLTVGRIVKEKGYLEYMPAFAEMVKKGYDVKWFLVGQGDYTELLKKHARELGIEDNVVFLGMTINPYKYMDKCDVFLQPSLYEGHSVTILEAKYLCLPILCTNFSGLKDEIVNRKNGVVMNHDFQSLVEGSELMLGSEEMRTQFRKTLLAEKVSEENADSIFI